LTLPVILDIQTNPPNDSVKLALVTLTAICGFSDRGPQTEVTVSLSHQLML